MVILLVATRRGLIIAANTGIIGFTQSIGYTVIQLYSYTVIQSYGYTVIQLYSYTVIPSYHTIRYKTVQ